MGTSHALHACARTLGNLCPHSYIFPIDVLVFPMNVCNCMSNIFIFSCYMLFPCLMVSFA